VDRKSVRKIVNAGYTIEDAVVRLPAIVSAHLRTTGETPRSFGMRVVGDPNFVSEISNGRQPRLTTIARVLAAIKRSEAQCAA
jgi:hypothetical protein